MKDRFCLSLGLILLTAACSVSPTTFESQFEPQPVTLDTFPVEKLEVYVQDQPIFVDMDELLVTIDDPQVFEDWNTMLGNCQTHRRNHPRYTDHYLVVVYFEDGHALYEVTVDSHDGDKIDMSPIQTEQDFDFSVTHELGLYRCEGLEELVDEITSR